MTHKIAFFQHSGDFRHGSPDPKLFYFLFQCSLFSVLAYYHAVWNKYSGKMCDYPIDFQIFVLYIISMGKHCHPCLFLFSLSLLLLIIYHMCVRIIVNWFLCFLQEKTHFLILTMSTSTAPSSASSDADSLNHDENPIKAVIFDYGEVMWMQSRNVHVYRSEFFFYL